MLLELGFILCIKMNSLQIYQFSFREFQEIVIKSLNLIAPFIYHQPIYFSLLLLLLLYLLNWLKTKSEDESKERSIQIMHKNLKGRNINQTNIIECRDILMKFPDIPNMCLPNSANTTFLQFACKRNHTEIIKIMLLCGGDVHILGKNGSTLFHMVTYNIVNTNWFGKFESLQLLLCAGCNINAQQNCGFTALHIAAIFGHFYLCRWLLDVGIQPNIKSYNGLTAADLADLNDHPQVADLIMSNNNSVVKNLYSRIEAASLGQYRLEAKQLDNEIYSNAT